VKEVRGIGLMLGLEIPGKAKLLAQTMFAHRVLINACNDDTVRFLPPLVIEEENLREGIAVLRRSLSELEKREA